MKIVFEIDESIQDLVLPDLADRFRVIGWRQSPLVADVFNYGKRSALPYAAALLNPKGYNIPDANTLVLPLVNLLSGKAINKASMFNAAFNQLLDDSLDDQSLPQVLRDNYVALKLLLIWGAYLSNDLERVTFRVPKDDSLFAAWTNSVVQMDQDGQMMTFLASLIQNKSAEQISSMSSEEKIRWLVGVTLTWKRPDRSSPS